MGKDEVDAAEKYSLETGQEWPDGEDPGIARYRLFYQVTIISATVCTCVMLL